MRSISEELDQLIGELKKQKMKPEHIVMGKNLCMQWLVESTQGTDFILRKAKKYDFTHQGIPIIVCESEILEVLPNAKDLFAR